MFKCSSTMKSGQNRVNFKSQELKLSGDLYLPKNFNKEKKYPTIVFSGPFNQVKEQMGSVYGKQFSDKNYVFLCFDHRGYGDSEGNIRNYEKYDWKQEGIRDAISFLRTLPFVDKDKFYGIGGCASGGYMASVAVTDKRLKAIATISGMMNPQGMFFGVMTKEQLIPLFKEANEARQKQYETGKYEYKDVLGYENVDPNTLPEGSRREGYDYYMTDRAGKSKYPNYSLKTLSNLMEDQCMTNPTVWAPYLYTPYLGIYGEKAKSETGAQTIAYYEACSKPKELYEIQGASHVSLYDIENDVSRAVNKIDEFFKKY